MEFAANGELFDYVAESGPFSEPESRFFLHKMLIALDHLHSKGYCNRDIKPENIFFGDQYVLKLSDMGFSTFIKGKKGDGKLQDFSFGTPGYIAPEILL